QPRPARHGYDRSVWLRLASEAAEQRPHDAIWQHIGDVTGVASVTGTVQRRINWRVWLSPHFLIHLVCDSRRLGGSRSFVHSSHPTRHQSDEVLQVART